MMTEASLQAKIVASMKAQGFFCEDETLYGEYMKKWALAMATAIIEEIHKNAVVEASGAAGAVTGVVK